MKLIELAKVYVCKIVTNDFNLNKVAQLHGVEVLNINELANALKPVVLPGETMRVFILKEGKEYNQGVAYLDDGTMVVVDNARKMISKTIDIAVTSVLQTTAGKMIFGRFDERTHAVHDRSQEHRAPDQERDQERAARETSPAPASVPAAGGGGWRVTYNRNSAHESLRHPSGRGSGHAHGPGEIRHQPQAVHAAGRRAHPDPHHPQVSALPLRRRNRGGPARRGYGLGARPDSSGASAKAGARGGGRRNPPAIGGERAGEPGLPLRIWWPCTTPCVPSSTPSWWNV